MPMRARRIVAAFRGDASLRRALRELAALGVKPSEVVQVTDILAARRQGLLLKRQPPSAHDERLEDALSRGATLLLIPAHEAEAEKRISLALLRYSEGPVQVQNDVGVVEKDRGTDMKLKRIRLEMARNPGFPEGSARHGYEFTAPLALDGHIDGQAWRSPEVRGQCRVRRFWDGEPEQDGELIHTRRREWAFSYAPGEDDDEAVAKLDRHRIKEGEYLTIREPDGRSFTFRIASIDG